MNESFNFWHDIKSNIVTRTNWEDRNTSNPIVPIARDSSNKRGLDSSATRSLMTDKTELDMKIRLEKEALRKLNTIKK